MPIITKPLTNTEVSYAKPKEKEYILADGNGLNLRIKPNGTKVWVFNYRKQDGKRTNLSLGFYPTISLSQARIIRDDYQTLLSQGIDPKIHREQQDDKPILPSLLDIAKLWKEKRISEVEEDTMKKNWGRLEKHLFPVIGNTPIAEITPQLLIQSLGPLSEEGKYDTLHRIIRLTNMILDYAVNTGVITFNYCEKAGQAFSRIKSTPQKSIHYNQLPRFLTDLYLSNSSIMVKALIHWQLLTMLRPAEAVSVEWSEINFVKRVWDIPGFKMKGNIPHIVPLSTQAISLLEKLQPISGYQKFVFPSQYATRRGLSMSKQTANSYISKMGYSGKQTSHGLRSIARTYLTDQGVPYELAEACLGHRTGSTVSRAYNRSDYLEQRRPIMQLWGDYVEQCSKQSTF